MALWADDYLLAMALLRRIFPPGLLRFLQQKRTGTGDSRPTSPVPVCLANASSWMQDNYSLPGLWIAVVLQHVASKALLPCRITPLQLRSLRKVARRG